MRRGHIALLAAVASALLMVPALFAYPGLQMQPNRGVVSAQGDGSALAVDPSRLHLPAWRGEPPVDTPTPAPISAQTTPSLTATYEAFAATARANPTDTSTLLLTDTPTPTGTATQTDTPTTTSTATQMPGPPATPTRKPTRHANPAPDFTPTATPVPPPVPVYARKSSLPWGKAGAFAIAVPTAPANCSLFGLNISGGEWGRVRPENPDVYGDDFFYPSPSELDYYRSKGLVLVRMPLRWEHLQKSLFGPLDTVELARLDGVMLAASARGMWIWPEPHNNARYYGHVIGSPDVPYEAFADFWGKLAKHLRTSKSLYAYDLTDEPHDTGGLWQGAAQAAIDSIRRYDMSRPIVVGGDAWSGSVNWVSNNDRLKKLKDPARNLIFDAHVFFDADSSGRYLGSYDDEGAYPEVGIDRVRPFVEWLAANRLRGIVGGYGVPDDDPRWLTALDTFMSYLDASGLGGAYWAGGSRWGSYPLSVEPRDGLDRPQMEVLQKYKGNCPR